MLNYFLLKKVKDGGPGSGIKGHRTNRSEQTSSRAKSNNMSYLDKYKTSPYKSTQEAFSDYIKANYPKDSYSQLANKKETMEMNYAENMQKDFDNTFKEAYPNNEAYIKAMQNAPNDKNMVDVLSNTEDKKGLEALAYLTRVGNRSGDVLKNIPLLQQKGLLSENMGNYIRDYYEKKSLEKATYDLVRGSESNLNGRESGAFALLDAFKSANISAHEVPEGYNKYTGKWEDESVRPSPSKHQASGNYTASNVAYYNGSRYRANGNPNNPHTVWERY